MDVIFDPSGGSFEGQRATVHKTVQKDNKVEFPKDPVKDGLNFKGWFTQISSIADPVFWTKESVFSIFMDQWNEDFNSPDIDNRFDGKFLLRAYWEAKVTYDSDGGSDVPEELVWEGKTATEPQAPTKDGYTFTGWYSNGEKYDFTKPVNEDLKLIAKWKEIPKYEVAFDTTGGSEVKSQQVVKGNKAKKPENEPTRKGYKFLGWFEGPNGGKAFDFNKAIYTNVTVYAQWDKEEVTPPTPEPGDHDNPTPEPGDHIKPTPEPGHSDNNNPATPGLNNREKKPAKTVDKKTVKTSKTPNTADSTDLSGYGLMLLAGTALTVIANRKRNMR